MALSDRLALAIEAAWYKAPKWLLLLTPLEWCFAALTGLRRQLYAKDWLKRQHPGIPVIVVGNISVGGTGKTPVVMAICRALQAQGLRVAVVSRGYGGTARGVLRVDSNSLASAVGDEALLIARSTEAAVFVGRDRAAAAMAAASGADVIVSDDGLQHYALKRDIEVVTMDAQHGFGNGHLLPVGPLREPPRRLATVDFLLQRGGQDPHSGTLYTPHQFRLLDGEQTCAADKPTFGPRVHAIAAIARPERFFATLRGLGFDVVEHPLPDHESIDAVSLAKLHDLPVVMTSKDAVKYSPTDHPALWVLDMQLQFPDEFMGRLVRKIHQLRARQT